MLNIVSTIVLKTFRKSIDVILSFFPENCHSLYHILRVLLPLDGKIKNNLITY